MNRYELRVYSYRFQEALFRFKNSIGPIECGDRNVFFKYRFFFNGLISGVLVSAVLIKLLFSGSFERTKLLDDQMLDIDLCFHYNNKAV